MDFSISSVFKERYTEEEKTIDHFGKWIRKLHVAGREHVHYELTIPDTADQDGFFMQQQIATGVRGKNNPTFGNIIITCASRIPDLIQHLKTGKMFTMNI